MKYAQIRKYDVANGTGIRTSIFVTGCNFRCKGCFNKEYQDFNYGKEWTDKDTELLKSYLLDENVSGLTILGGEPFEHSDDLSFIIEEISNVLTNKNIWIYSGYRYEDLIKDTKKFKLLKKIDILVDGQFILEKKNLKLKFRGSENQRIIDVKTSIKKKEIEEIDI